MTTTTTITKPSVRGQILAPKPHPHHLLTISIVAIMVIITEMYVGVYRSKCKCNPATHQVQSNYFGLRIYLRTLLDQFFPNYGFNLVIV
jgi:hypothetical protein